MADEFAAAQPHGEIQEVFKDLFYVQGTVAMGPGMRATRNMTIVREGGDLVLLNAVRLSKQGEADLAKLGEIKHVFRLGAFHGMDDAYYVKHHKAKYWTFSNARDNVKVKADEELNEQAKLPITKAKLVQFRNARFGEGVLFLDQDGGVLLACDGVQHHETTDGNSLLAKLFMKVMGFTKYPAIVGKPWLNQMENRNGPSLQTDYERILELPFTHMLAAHGAVLKNSAHTELKAMVKRRYASTLSHSFA
jgi:hypothetical protein